MAYENSLLSAGPMPDLAPMIHRQRLVVEGRVNHVITEDEITRYLKELSDFCKMDRLIEPVTHCSDLYGWAGWVHWEASGAHLYAWERPVLFFSVDIYTCAPFDSLAVVGFTGDFFAAEEVVAKDF